MKGDIKVGILYEKVMEHKRRLALRDLNNMNIQLSQSGAPVEELEFDELMYEWRLAAFKMIDVDSDQNNWF